MGNLGKLLNFPLFCTRKGAVEPRRSNWYCAARFTCEKGNFAPWSQSTACRVVRVFWYLKAVAVNLVRRGPIPGCSLVLASWASPVSDYCGELTRGDALSLGNWESPVAPRKSAYVGD